MVLGHQAAASMKHLLCTSLRVALRGMGGVKASCVYFLLCALCQRGRQGACVQTLTDHLLCAWCFVD